MREQVIDFLYTETSYTYEELNKMSDEELDTIVSKYFSIEY